jgi:hypothetical protein
MVEVWYGDEFIGVFTYAEYCDMKERYDYLRFEWCEGYGP